MGETDPAVEQKELERGNRIKEDDRAKERQLKLSTPRILLHGSPRVLILGMLHNSFAAAGHLIGSRQKNAVHKICLQILKHCLGEIKAFLCRLVSSDGSTRAAQLPC
jgi:hypothetical protein